MEKTDIFINLLHSLVSKYIDDENMTSITFKKYYERYMIDKVSGSTRLLADCVKTFISYELSHELLLKEKVKIGAINFSIIYSSVGNEHKELIKAYLDVVETKISTTEAAVRFGIITKTPVIESISTSSSSEEDTSSSEEEGLISKDLINHIMKNFNIVMKSREEYINNLPLPEGNIF